jgi:hypothetical protein
MLLNFVPPACSSRIAHLPPLDERQSFLGRHGRMIPIAVFEIRCRPSWQHHYALRGGGSLPAISIASNTRRVRTIVASGPVPVNSHCRAGLRTQAPGLCPGVAPCWGIDDCRAANSCSGCHGEGCRGAGACIPTCAGDGTRHLHNGLKLLHAGDRRYP